jgi:hypothetical protein
MVRCAVRFGDRHVTLVGGRLREGVRRGVGGWLGEWVGRGPGGGVRRGVSRRRRSAPKTAHGNLHIDEAKKVLIVWVKKVLFFLCGICLNVIKHKQLIKHFTSPEIL